VDYRITVPAGSSTTIDASTITSPADEFMTKINLAMEDADLGYQLTALDAPEPTVTIVTLNTTASVNGMFLADLDEVSRAFRVCHGMEHAALGLLMAAGALLTAW